MKDSEKQDKKKLELNKQTVAHLSQEELSEIKAGKFTKCWENLWTLYYCGLVWTGLEPNPEPDPDDKTTPN
ncbi:MAG: hypothetical protein GY940_12265 [bacterium]|nr:hypothetical protein [bacterium]